jgi:hypothetical protein
MQLFLAEADVAVKDSAALRHAVARVEEAITSSGGQVVEALDGRDLGRLFIVVEHTTEYAVQRALADGGLPNASVKPARIVGADLAAAKAARGEADYLVQWNLPNGLTMDAYIKRKMERSANYAKVPEVTFKRTYVCEDMSKCLCLYDAPDLAAVLRARQAVEAGVDGATTVESLIPSEPASTRRGQ